MIGTMRGQREVVDSFEGIRVAISGGVCDFDEYDFNENRWQLKERCAWPRPRARAEDWLKGWNSVDRFTAFNLLVAPQPNKPEYCAYLSVAD